MMALEESMDSAEKIEGKLEEILIKRSGTIVNTEVFYNKKECLLMFPNGASIMVKKRNSDKYVAVKIFNGISDITGDLMDKRMSKKFKSSLISPLVDKVSELT